MGDFQGLCLFTRWYSMYTYMEYIDNQLCLHASSLFILDFTNLINMITVGYLHINIWYHQLDTLILSFVSNIGDSYYKFDPNYVQGLRGNLMLTKLSDFWKTCFKITWSYPVQKDLDTKHFQICHWPSSFFGIKNKVIMCPYIFWHHMVVSMGIPLALIHF